MCCITAKHSIKAACKDASMTLQGCMAPALEVTAAIRLLCGKFVLALIVRDIQKY